MKDQLLRSPTIVVPREVFGIGQMAASAELNQKLNGVLLESLGQDRHRAVATDGHILAVIEWQASGMRDEFEQKAELSGHTRPATQFTQYIPLGTWQRIEKQLKKKNQPLAHFLAVNPANVHAIVIAEDADIAVASDAHDFPFPAWQELIPNYAIEGMRPAEPRGSNRAMLDCNLVFRAAKFITSFDDQWPCTFEVPNDPARPVLIDQSDGLGNSTTIVILPVNSKEQQA